MPQIPIGPIGQSQTIVAEIDVTAAIAGLFAALQANQEISETGLTETYMTHYRENAGSPNNIYFAKTAVEAMFANVLWDLATQRILRPVGKANAYTLTPSGERLINNVGLTGIRNRITIL